MGDRSPIDITIVSWICSLLDRSLSRDERAVQAILTGDTLSPADSLNFLKDWAGGDIPPVGTTSPLPGYPSKTLAPTQHGPASVCPPSGNGSTPLKAPTADPILGGARWRDDAVPTPDRGRSMQPASDVDAHPVGTSPFGVGDLVGKRLAMDRRVRRRARPARPSCAAGVIINARIRLVFPASLPVTQHGKYLLMAPSLDRSGAIGFRCATDSVG